MRLESRGQAHKATPPAVARRRALQIVAGLGIGVAALASSATPARGSSAGADAAVADVTADADTSPSAVAARPLALIENRRMLSYPFAQVWPTAIRYLRIDRGFKVVDRDEEAGYMLFEFPVDSGGTGSGSVEMFATEDASGRPSVSISVNTGAGPVHLPNAILDGIAAKVRAERGQPSAPPKQDPAPKQPPPDDDDGSVPLLPPAVDP